MLGGTVNAAFDEVFPLLFPGGTGSPLMPQAARRSRMAFSKALASNGFVRGMPSVAGIGAS